MISQLKTQELKIDIQPTGLDIEMYNWWSTYSDATEEKQCGFAFVGNLNVILLMGSAV